MPRPRAGAAARAHADPAAGSRAGAPAGRLPGRPAARPPPAAPPRRPRPAAPRPPPPAATTVTRPLPERAELLPGVWRLPLPLVDSPLNHVNTYLVRADDGYLLVDCGWDTSDCLRALEGHLRALDIRFGDVRHLVVTHIH